MVFVFLHISEDTEILNPIQQTFIKSLYTFYPEAEIIQVSDKKTKKIDKVTNVFRFDGDINKIMEFRINSYKELALNKPAIYLDSDMIITKKFDIKKILNLNKNVLLKRSFDLDMKFNTKIKNLEFDEFNNKKINEVFPILACFIKSNSHILWDQMSQHLDRLEKKFLYWYGDQEILKNLYFEDSKRYEFVDEKYFACLPKYIDKKSFPFIIHFKGFQNKEIFKNKIKLVNDYLEFINNSK